MKKMIIFVGSFSIFYLAVQWISGYILTMMYAPSIVGGEQTAVSFGGVSTPFVFALFSAILAFLISSQIGKRTMEAV
ncbi:hypothetical protein [Alkalicoccobacillus porphyridii]|uniref:Uncharacterized protein n=1 Tax=Alkalicoccobacillus porphyridii TaxID=2597270 RepID=A0A554A1X1_9BACI|nr:hypothetical protein [Alkalicoccobacillus porphyridii]TSB47675.1 hypothetical protein FN960_03930 [Alkalicoccobacillus porphyridii]